MNFELKGKTVAAFMADTDSYVKALVGAKGSGKTYACIMHEYYRAVEEYEWRVKKGEKPKFIERKVLVIKRYSVDLERTIIPDFRSFYGEYGSLKKKAPYDGFFDVPISDDCTARLIYEFKGIESKEEAQRQLKSTQYTSIYINEADQVERGVFVEALGRVGRYQLHKGEVYKPQIYMDFNVANNDSWLYDMFIKNKSIEFAEYDSEGKPTGKKNVLKASLYKQPQPLFMPYIEDIKNGKELTDEDIVPNPEIECPIPDAITYYMKQVKELVDAKDWNGLYRDILLKWADSDSGQRVHREFDYEKHVGEFEVEESQKLYIGIDTSGVNPSAVLGQCFGGVMIIHDELYIEGMAFNYFVEELLLPLLATKYAKIPRNRITAVCDPNNARCSGTGVTPIATLIKELGIKAVAAKTNYPKVRIESVNSALMKKSFLNIDKRCEMLIEALQKGYVYPKNKIGHIHDQKPKKNEWSHLCDALQYFVVHQYMVARGSPDKPLRKFKMGNMLSRL